MESMDGDVNPTRIKVLKIEDRFNTLMAELSDKKNDLKERKDALARIIKAVDDARSWSADTNETLENMVTTKPDLKESKEQINLIEVQIIFSEFQNLD